MGRRRFSFEGVSRTVYPHGRSRPISNSVLTSTPGDPGRSRYRATFAVLATAVATYALLQSLVIPVLPTIQAGLHTSQNTVTWVLTAYLLSASIFTPIMGRLGDMRGKEQMLLV